MRMWMRLLLLFLLLWLQMLWGLGPKVGRRLGCIRVLIWVSTSDSLRFPDTTGKGLRVTRYLILGHESGSLRTG